MIMNFFKFGVSLQLASVYHGEAVKRCAICGTLRRLSTYDGIELQIHLPHYPNRSKQWPMIGGTYHTIVQAQLAQSLISAGITGFKLHEPKFMSKELGDYSCMPKIPEYYILEPTGMIDFVIPEAEYRPPCHECGHLKPKRFGSPKVPFVFLEDTWDGSDIVRIRNHWQHIMFFNRKVIDVFRENGWHHQIAYGENGKPYDSISFGGATSPGITVQNIDSDTWYEDTITALKDKYPDYPHIPQF